MHDQLIAACEAQGLALYRDGNNQPYWLTKREDWEGECAKHKRNYQRYLTKYKGRCKWDDNYEDEVYE